jgi:hypothetical protein
MSKANAIELLIAVCCGSILLWALLTQVGWRCHRS